MPGEFPLLQRVRTKLPSAANRFAPRPGRRYVWIHRDRDAENIVAPCSPLNRRKGPRFKLAIPDSPDRCGTDLAV